MEALKWSQVYDHLEEVASSLEQTINAFDGIIQKKV